MLPLSGAHSAQHARPHAEQNLAGHGSFSVTTVRADGIQARLRAVGDLDLATAGLLTAVLHQRRATGYRYVRLDLSGLSFLDAGGLGVLVRGHHDFLACRGRLVLTGVGPRIQRLLHITGLDQTLLCLAPTVDDVTPDHPAGAAPHAGWQTGPAAPSPGRVEPVHDSVPAPPRLITPQSLVGSGP